MSGSPPAAGPWLIWRLAAVGVCFITAAVLAFVLALGPAPLPPALVLAVALPVGLVGADLVLTVFTLHAGKDLRLWRKGTPQLHLVLRLALIGRWFTRTDHDRVFQSFVQANNQLLRVVLRGRGETGRSATRLLLLAPTCLQAGDCKKEITTDASLCERCGRCPVKDLVELAEGRGLELHFVGGGTLARSLLARSAPDLVIAVACERELTEGILFSRKVPVMAVPNTRPKGPCKETQVDITDVREAVEALGA